MPSKLQAIFSRARAERSWSRAAGKALRNPEKAWTYFRRSGSRAWVKALFANAAEYERLRSELDASQQIVQLRARLDAAFSLIDGATDRGHRYVPGAMVTTQAELLYALIRARQPERIVETGVCNGFSSAVILAALERNGAGRLYSIDLPEFAKATPSNQGFWQGKGGAVVPADKQSGWLVPRHLRNRWVLRLGQVREQLPALLDELGTIDLFIHDSEHSYENQLFEFRSAFAHLSPGGVLFASDINWSKAFDHFTRKGSANARSYYVSYSLGILLRT